MQAVRPSSQSSDVDDIQHEVSKMDTLAGLAIKYGVEVADIKRVNGLATDHQIFARKLLLIPMPGKHPPSPIASSPASSNRIRDEFLDTFSSPKSKPPQPKASPRSALVEITEIATQIPAKALNLEAKQTPTNSNWQRRSRSFAIENLPGDVNLDDAIAVAVAGISKAGSSNSVRRRQKADTDAVLLNSDLTTNKANVVTSIRKSSSTSNLQESDCSSPVWGSSGKPDGLRKPLGAWKNKAALD